MSLDAPKLKSTDLQHVEGKDESSLVGNYARYETFDALVKDVLNGVRAEWLVNKTTMDIFFTSLRSIYAMAKADRCINYCPSPRRLLTVFKAISPKDVKVIMTAQEPYSNLLDALGVAFASVAPSKCIPKIAQAINSCLHKYKHIDDVDVDYETRSAHYGTWLGRGVLLLNASFTVDEQKPGVIRPRRSHAIHWKDVVPAFLSLIPNPKKCVAVLFGDDAKQLYSSINITEIVKHVHPVARSGIQKSTDLTPFEELGFTRYNPKGYWEKIDVFTAINHRLKLLEMDPIDWRPARNRNEEGMEAKWKQMKGWD